MQNALIEKLKKQIEDFTPSEAVDEVGTVTAVGDGVAEIAGLAKVRMAEMIAFDATEGRALKDSLEEGAGVIYGLVLNLEEDAVRAVILGDTRRIKEGMTAKRTGRILSVPVGTELLGRVVDALAEPLDGKGPTKAKTMYEVERPSYGVVDRSAVNTPLHTGIKAIDAMIPIGRGQRELIIGDRHTGKTVIALDMILNQKNEPKDKRPICVYVAIGQKESKTARIAAMLKEAGAMDYTIIVDAPSSAPAALQYLAPFTGSAIAEFFMEQGTDAVVIYDDLSKHAVAYRQLSLLLRRPPGREAYPGDIFYLHSRLLERAAKLSEKRGGGSVTALPIIETQEGDVSAYIPTNVISITDGQLFLEPDLFNKGVRPAMNVGVSVSRVGSAAQTKAMKKVAGKMRLQLAQFRELEAFAQFASDLDEGTKKQISAGERLVEILKQGQHKPLPFEQQVVQIYAANSGFFDEVEVADVSTVAGELVDFIDNQHGAILKSINESKDLSDDVQKKLDHAFSTFKASKR